MRTKKQQEAARRNGARSKGPVTAEGKQRSAQNALRHGLSSKVVVLSSEKPEAFQDVLNAYIAHWQPVGQVELDLVHDIVSARWRLNRTLAIETASLDLEMDRQRAHVQESYARIDEPTRCTLAFHALCDTGRGLANLSRQEARLRRALDRATHELVRLRNERGQTDSEICTNEPGNAEVSARHTDTAV